MPCLSFPAFQHLSIAHFKKKEGIFDSSNAKQPRFSIALPRSATFPTHLQLAGRKRAQGTKTARFWNEKIGEPRPSDTTRGFSL